MKQVVVLAHTDALIAIGVIQARLEAEQKGAAIAVVDAHGELIAFLRTDGCRLQSITIAQNKAFSAAREQKPSRDIGQSSREKGFPLSNYGDGRFVGWGGGVPIIIGGVCVGAVGVSGLPEEEDIVLAQAGVDAIVAAQG